MWRDDPGNHVSGQKDAIGLIYYKRLNTGYNGHRDMLVDV